MSDKHTPPSEPPIGRRRSSIAGQWAELINRNPSSSTTGTSAYPGPISAAAQAQQRRRLSLTTVGLSGSPTGSSPFSNMRSRGESLSSANSSTVDESPFEDADATAASASVPSTPFGRRMSFGARAMRETRGSAGAVNGEGFNFADNLRTRAERSSISTASGPAAPSTVPPHQRAKSVAVMEPPKEVAKPRTLDSTQERILKGDFYMD
ncbi:hypothetical protein P152DRAFT_199422 [Eremomyces bilateralis CBS 781.70]|uniref:Uncharacterized protein n=1 Tax=Eremomyces bilateralis CBS 781.70 TaxID=1392243 RepID=A0A6G1GCN7_9PEZI|nr:uncharacterized protein P152DRAFT_199422 [Eremomyces bilateralis CBS 781.70]KAF1815847.1 hypothetical protein P152DRAFT_199422 [Eremomyces bilateralis CBS 781.70]